MKKTKVLVGLASCGIAAGANKVYNKLKALQEADKLDIELKITGCIGMCYREPLVEVIDETGSYLYGEINEEKAVEIFDKHLKQSEPVKDYVVKSDLFKSKDDDFWDGQVKIALRNCGVINPENIGEYEEHDGYVAIKKILERKISEEQVIKTVLDSGIRGRGGGGFPTGMKWRFAYNNKAETKYIICNADEGDPGAFMDR
ncbi:MAG: NADH-quinone oxidoreductase subunit J/K, partial [Bacteroidales bacterium]|nr:NADH-quinone oxidoreductase subunit J/K [Bacteroidales bacterium]